MKLRMMIGRDRLISLGRNTRLLIAAAVAMYSLSAEAADSEGPLDPSGAAGSNWKHPSYVFVSDDTRASYSGTLQEILSAGGFGFASVDGTVEGIIVEIEGYGIGSSPPEGDQIDVALTKDGSSPAGSWKSAVELPNGLGNEDYVSAGASDDLWGTSWTPSEILDPDFGVLVRDTDTLASPLNIDHIRVTVYFTAGSNPTRRVILQRFIMGE